ncbi:MAG TPA: type II toxin-antitoxin system prevent-host-death family antitoxin [Candidatus Paceibacterota bacterium]|nr:type II toxin-antitoxin system prevent-host-death family antitoxin [Verrucomicrobiota bacterium]HOX04175.1 type II toxin-antitoxin system prevent-host-death family antitoxin [Verrucomicrobiota bacterium]HRZ45364.1 type II toxin-antitoxin system prevent-host-death family antitoxin [Candidatus Paceibacterota bacterium]HRZ54010.1 type II toxin-antitoxin system prevent-host-death family antitoxin [Candidatus Paceibacterota bacterium]
MSTTTVEEFQRNVGGYLAEVEKGHELVISKNNQPFARLVPATSVPRKNRTKIGWADSTLKILGPVTGPVLEEEIRTGA